MRNGWKETTLGEVLTLEYGKPLKEGDRDGESFPVFGSAGQVGLHSEPLLSTEPNIIVGRKGTAGAVHWSENRCSVIDTAYFIENKTDALMRFLYLLLLHVDLPSLSAQTGVPGLNRDRAYSTSILLPPLAEQKRIVDVIESVDAYVAGLESYATAARAARAALLHELLTTNTDDWVPFQVRDLAIKKGLVGGPFGSSLVSTDYTNTGVPVIRGANLPNSHRFVTGDFVFVSDKKAEELTRNIALPGDIIATQRGTLGQVGIVPEDAWPRYVVSQSQMRLRVNENVALRDFVYLWLDSGPVRADIGSKKSATANPHINLGIFGDLEGRLPPLAEQKRIVDVIESVDEAISGADKAAADARNLRSGLLSDLLSGDHEIPESYDRLLESA